LRFIVYPANNIFIAMNNSNHSSNALCCLANNLYFSSNCYTLLLKAFSNGVKEIYYVMKKEDNSSNYCGCLMRDGDCLLDEEGISTNCIVLYAVFIDGSV
jgi:hypothetical protein